jgi:hypothetical protein
MEVEGEPGTSGAGGPLARPPSYEGAKRRDGFAEDQSLHLIHAFVCIECLGVRDEAPKVAVAIVASYSSFSCSSADIVSRA